MIKFILTFIAGMAAMFCLQVVSEVVGTPQCEQNHEG